MTSPYAGVGGKLHLKISNSRNPFYSQDILRLSRRGGMLLAKNNIPD